MAISHACAAVRGATPSLPKIDAHSWLSLRADAVCCCCLPAAAAACFLCVVCCAGHLLILSCANPGATYTSPLTLAYRPWSICLWFQISDMTMTAQTVMSVGDGSDYSVGPDRQLFGLEFVTNLQFTLSSTVVPDVLSFYDVTRASAQFKWIQFCVTLLPDSQVGGGNGALSIYVKGSPFPQICTTDVEFRGASDLNFQSFSDSIGAMTVRLDNLMIWDRALTSVEVSHGFTTGSWTPAGLKIFFPFNEQSGRMAFDAIAQYTWDLRANVECILWGGMTVNDGHAVLGGPGVAAVAVPLNASTSGRPALKLTGKDWSVCLWTRLPTAAIVSATAQYYFSMGSADPSTLRRGGSVRLGYTASTPDDAIMSFAPFTDYVNSLGSSSKMADTNQWKHTCVVWSGAANATRPSRASNLKLFANGIPTNTMAQTTCSAGLVGVGSNFCTNLEIGQSCVIRCAAGQAPSKAPAVCDQFGAGAATFSHSPTCAALAWSTVATNTDYGPHTESAQQDP